MDNITHTLIGALVGEAAATRREPRETQSDLQGRTLLVWTGALGSNLPDFDLLYTTLAHTKVSYLLQHRGYTHTIVGALMAGLLLLAGSRVFARWRKWNVSAGDRRRIVSICFFVPLLHIGMDFTNNYGVHPFWPWYNGWFYGDSVFIIEPLLWAACAPLAFTLRSLVGRILVRAVLIAAIVLPIATALVPVPAVVIVAVVLGLLLWIARSIKVEVAIACGIACWLLVTAMFATAHSHAAQLVQRISREQLNDAHWVDAVLTPLPANPLCWEILFVQTRGGKLVLRRAMLALAPSIIDASRCPTRGFDEPITAPLADVNADNSPAIKWYGEIRPDVQNLRELNRSDCHAAAFFRFARAPWFAIVNHRPVLGDLRYDREKGLGFTELEVNNSSKCGASAPWIPPRNDVLSDPIFDAR